MIKHLLLILSIGYTWFAFRDLFQELTTVYRDSTGPVPARLFAVLRAWVTGALSCGRCFCFYLGLGFSLNLVVAAVASAAYDLYERVKLKLFL